MASNLILSGGAAHDYATTSPMVVEILRAVNVESVVEEDLRILEGEELDHFEIITLNCARWTCSQTEVSASWRNDFAYILPQPARVNILSHLQKGRGVLALHAATLCFDDWSEYPEILGASWEWGRSGHAPFGTYTMRFCREHPVTHGLEDFEIVDELYTDPTITDRVDPLLQGEWDGRLHPLLWLHKYDDARICYNALGHGPEAFEHETNQTLLQRGAQWVLGHLTAPDAT